MAYIDDIQALNVGDDIGDWNGTNGGGSSGFDGPTLNDSSATTPIYIEGTSCMWWPLKKGVANGYTYTDVIPATVSMTGKILVGFINYPFADISAIPINQLYMRVSSATGFTTNYGQVDAKAQIQAPENVPISGHTPIILYPDAATESSPGPNYGAIQSVGWVGTTGSTADGKQGGYDWFFIISYVGAHSATFNETFFSSLYDEYYDSGTGIPGTTNRPIAVLSQAGDFYLSNIKFQLGDGTSDTTNITVTETGKTVFFNNAHINHTLGYVFVNPASTNEIRFTLTDVVHFWNDQSSTAEIFDGIANVDDFKITGCAFSNGGKISLPSANVDRYVRNTKFSGCQTGTASDSEFTDSILSACGTMTVSGDADFTGSQVLESTAGTDGSALIWNGNFDPDGNLDGMVFSKGANAHHAIEFGIATPTTMTIRNIDFQNFSGTNGQSNSALYVRRTTGTVTINVIGCTGNISYKTSGAIVNLVINPVTAKVICRDQSTKTGIEGVAVTLKAADQSPAGPFPYKASVTITRSGSTATVSHTAHPYETGNKVEIDGADQNEYNRIKTITVIDANSYSFTVSGTPATPATGTITSTAVLIDGWTDANGEISDNRVYSSNQSVEGFAAKSTSSPLYKRAPLASTVDSANGVTITSLMISDE